MKIKSHYKVDIKEVKMKVLFDISVINIEYLKEVMDLIKTLKHKEKSLSQIKFLKEKEIHVYNIWHNKKSYTVDYYRQKR